MGPQHSIRGAKDGHIWAREILKDKAQREKRRGQEGALWDTHREWEWGGGGEADKGDADRAARAVGDIEPHYSAP